MIAKVRNQTLESFAGLGVVTHDTLAEYEALTDAEKMDGNVHLVLEEEPIDANVVKYTNDKTVKEELDGLASDLGSKSTASDVAGANAFAKIHQLNADLSDKGALVNLLNLDGATKSGTFDKTPYRYFCVTFATTISNAVFCTRTIIPKALWVGGYTEAFTQYNGGDFHVFARMILSTNGVQNVDIDNATSQILGWSIRIDGIR